MKLKEKEKKRFSFLSYLKTLFLTESCVTLFFKESAELGLKCILVFLKRKRKKVNVERERSFLYDVV
jgi:hypothetical protein